VVLKKLVLILGLLAFYFMPSTYGNLNVIYSNSVAYKIVDNDSQFPTTLDTIILAYSKHSYNSNENAVYKYVSIDSVTNFSDSLIQKIDYFNTQGKLSLELEYNKIDSGRIITDSVVYEYNVNLVKKSHYKFASYYQLAPVTLDEYYYDLNGNLSQFIQYNKKLSTDPDFRILEITNYAYDQNKITSLKKYTRGESNSYIVVDTFRLANGLLYDIVTNETTHYDGSGLISVKYRASRGSRSQSMSHRKLVYEYNYADDLSLVMDSVCWLPDGNDIVNMACTRAFSESRYVYDSQTTMSEYRWENGRYNFYRSEIWSYDEFGNLTFNRSNTSNSTRYNNYYFDDNNFLYRTFYYYSIYVGGGDPIRTFTDFTPFHVELTNNIKIERNVLIKPINHNHNYDVLGRKIQNSTKFLKLNDSNNRPNSRKNGH